MEDRRKFFRFETPLSVKYASEKGAYEGAAKTKNISREGVAFSADREFGTDETLRMEFEIPGDNFPVFAEGMVVWVNKKHERNFDVGIKLVSITRADRGRILEYAYQQWLRLKNIGRKEQ